MTGVQTCALPDLEMLELGVGHLRIVKIIVIDIIGFVKLLEMQEQGVVLMAIVRAIIAIRPHICAISV